MDDIVCSSPTFDSHVSDMNGMFAEARSSHMEFKFNKAQLNQSQVELWGSICDKDGRRPMPKKVTQIINWPEPRESHDLVSFLAFVNYLREYMNPIWVKYEAVFAPLRKKEAKKDFAKAWADGGKAMVGGATCTYKEAFERTRQLLHAGAVLKHIDYVAAMVPDQSGRPLEIFIDASDYGVCATLCQRPAPHRAPMIVAMFTKAFDKTQLN